MNPFQRLTIKAHLLGGTQISWILDRKFNDPGPYEYTVQVGRNVVDEAWVDINTVPLIDVIGAVVTDVAQRIWAQHPVLYYRVRLVTPVGEYFSYASQATGIMPRRDWLIARKVAHAEHHMTKKYGGAKGRYFKRRTFGIPCPGRVGDDGELLLCRDWNTDEVTASDCPVCFGTGIQCGYYAAVDYPILLTPIAYDRQNTEPRATHEDTKITGRAIAWPMAEHDDVWVDTESDQRYYVGAVQIVTAVRGVPLIQQFELRRAPVTDPCYQLPLDGPICDDESYYAGYGSI